LLARDQLLSWEVSQREQRIMTGVKASPECAFLCTYVTSPLRRNLVWMIQSSLLGVRRRLGSSAIGMFSVHRKSRRCVCGPSNNAHPTTPASARHRRPRSLTGFCDAPSSAA
jgi:hypothetical protein